MVADLQWFVKWKSGLMEELQQYDDIVKTRPLDSFERKMYVEIMEDLTVVDDEIVRLTITGK